MLNIENISTWYPYLKFPLFLARFYKNFINLYSPNCIIVNKTLFIVILKYYLAD